jgi:uncharacterized protein (DUF433 family)
MLQGLCSRTDEHPAALQPEPAARPHGPTNSKPMHFARITNDPAVMGGRPCIRGLRITVATILDLLGDGTSRERILQAYPQLEPDDIKEALAYACTELP